MAGYEQPGMEVALAQAYRERHSKLQNVENEKHDLFEVNIILTVYDWPAPMLTGL